MWKNDIWFDDGVSPPSPTELKRTKDRARAALRYAVRQGKIKRGACVICHKKAVDGHHDDYSKPLEVIWLCRQCHAKFHRKHGFYQGADSAVDSAYKAVVPDKAMLAFIDKLNAGNI